MEPENDIMGFLGNNPDGMSTSDIAQSTGHTRATIAKYLEMMKLQGKVSLREVGKAKVWVSANKTRRILVAEDEGHIRRLITVILGKENYEFTEAKDGKEALEKASEMPDLIILDLMMPKIDGIEVCRQLKNNALTRKIPVLMLTAKGEMSDKVVGIRAGADDYLTKPFEPRELRIRVGTFFDRGKKERNPVTNLPGFEQVFSRLKEGGEGLNAYYIFFRNLGLYRKTYGLSKTNELIRLAAQVITHSLEKISETNFVGHDSENNFILAIKTRDAQNVLKNIRGELESTIPFFYDTDCENIDFKKNLLMKMGAGGKIEKIALVQLDVKQLDADDVADIGKLSRKLGQMRGDKNEEKNTSN